MLPASLRPACAAVLAVGFTSSAAAEVPYDGWRGQRAEPSFAGANYGRRPLDNSPRYGEPYTSSRPAPVGRPELWTGFYIGGTLGGGWGHASVKGISGQDVTIDGFTGGLHGGYNWQIGSFVLGAEADFALSGMDGSLLHASSATAAYAGLDWTASLRGRLGYAWDNLLVYGTAGVATARVGLDVLANDVSGSRDRMNGFVWGGGVEMKINPNLSVRVEALRYNFGEETFSSIVGPLTLGSDVTTVRAGLSWHF